MRPATRRLNLQCLESRIVPTVPNLLVTFRNAPNPPQVGEFTPDGTLLFAADNPATPNTSENGPHDVDVTEDGRWVVFNGHFDATLNIYDPVADTWEQATYPGWTSVGNDSYGGLTTAGNYVFVPDMMTYNGGEAKGIVRFRLSDLSAQRFSTTQEYTDLNIGLDGSLYALRSDYGPIDVYDPLSMNLLRTVTPADGDTYRGATADADGNLYVIDWNETVWKFSPTGQVLASYYIDGPEGEFFYDTLDIDISKDAQHLVIGSRFGWVVQMTTSFTDVSYFFASEDRVVHATFLEDPPDINSLRMVPSDGSTEVAEAGVTDSYTLALSRPPLADVTVTISPDSQVTTSTDTVVFTTSNWNVPQTITVTAVDDASDEGPHSASIGHSLASTDPNYNFGDVGTSDVTISDNDVSGIELLQSENLAVTEGTISDEYQIVLSTQPSADVTIELEPGNEISLSSTSLTFTAANWNLPQTVTVTSDDDTELEGMESSSIAQVVSSADPKYQAITLPTLSVSIADNNPGVMFTGNPQVSESGTASSYAMVLSTEPTADVTIALAGGGQLLLAPESIVFTAANWNIPQTVNVGAVNDLVAEGSHGGTIVHTASSLDPAYDQLAIPDMTATIADNDFAGVTVTPTSGLTVRESGTTASFSIGLTSVPIHPVTIELSSSDITQGVVSPQSVTFLPEDGLTPKTITVMGANDVVPDTDSAFQIVTSVSSSLDPNYDGMAVADVDVVNENDDFSQILNTVVITEEDGDRLTLKLTGPGTLVISLDDPDGDLLGTLNSIYVTGTDPLKSKLSLTVAKAKFGNGLTTIGSINGSDLASIKARQADLIGTGVQLNGWLGKLTVRNILSGADVIALGTPLQNTTIQANDIQAGTVINLGSRLKTFKAAHFGEGEIHVPSLGTMNIVGNTKQSISADFNGDLFVSGAGVTLGKSAVTKVNVKGTVSNAHFNVVGNMGSFQSGRFVGSELFVGFTPTSPADPFAGGTFVPGATLGTFRVLGLKNLAVAAFEDSVVAASKLGNVTLKSVLSDNGTDKYGLLAHESIHKLKVVAAEFEFDPFSPDLQHVGDFEVHIV